MSKTRFAMFGLVGLLAALSFSAPAFADQFSILYTINGTFSGDVNSAPLSGPNGSYAMSFSLPSNVTPDFFDTAAGDFAVAHVPLTYSFQCDGCASAATFTGNALDVDFAGHSLGGMFAVEFLAGRRDYFFEFQGPVLFAGSPSNPTLIPGGPFQLPNAGAFELGSNNFVNLGSATVVASAIPTPEPSTLALLLAGLGFAGGLALLKAHRRA